MIKYIEKAASDCINDWYYGWEYEISSLKKQENRCGNNLLAKTQHIAGSLININEHDYKSHLQRYSDLNSIYFNHQQEKTVVKRFQHAHKKLLSILLETPMTKVYQNLLYMVMAKVNYFQQLSASQYSNDKAKSKLWNINYDNYGHVYEFAYEENNISYALYVDLNGYFTLTGVCRSTKEVVRSYGLNEELPEIIEMYREAS